MLKWYFRGVIADKNIRVAVQIKCACNFEGINVWSDTQNTYLCIISAFITSAEEACFLQTLGNGTLAAPKVIVED